MEEGKRKVAPLARQKRGPNVNPRRKLVPPASAEPTMNLRAVMNAHGARLLEALGQQMNAHLNSMAAFEGASGTLRLQCSTMTMEVSKLLQAVELYQALHSEVLLQAALLQQLIADFAQHVHISQCFGPAGQ